MSNKKLEKDKVGLKKQISTSLERRSYTSLEQRSPQTINDALIKKISNNFDHLNIITLNFHSKSSNLDRIEKIEGLEKLVNLEELNLSYNMISKIENLSSLKKLKELNLADNNIRRIENLQELRNLEILNLNGNLISEIPQSILCIPKLRVLKIARNKFKDIAHFYNISLLENLTTLQINDNPFCKNIYMDILFLMCPKLIIVDGKRNENEKLEIMKQKGNFPKIFQNLDTQDQQLKDKKNRMEMLSNEKEKLIEKNFLLQEKIDNLEAEVDFKNTQYENKVKEVQEKIARISDLEQELSNNKIELLFLKNGRKTSDHKDFTSLLIKYEKQTTFLKNLREECEKDLKMLSLQGDQLRERTKRREIQKLKMFSEEESNENFEKISKLKEKIANTEKMISKLAKEENMDVSEINQKVVLSNKLKKLQEKLEYCEAHQQSMADQSEESEENSKRKDMNGNLELKLQENEALEREIFSKYQNVEKELQKIEKEKEIILSQIFEHKNFSRSFQSPQKEKEEDSQRKSPIHDFHKENLEMMPMSSNSNVSPIKSEINYQQKFRIEKNEDNLNLSQENLSILKREYDLFCEEIKKIHEKVSKYLKNKPTPHSYNDIKNKDLNKQLREILFVFRRKEAQIQKFEEEKVRFLEDFSRETEELTENWRLFDKKKMEYRNKLLEEKTLLYKELDAEYKKLSEYKAKSLRKSYQDEEIPEGLLKESELTKRIEEKERNLTLLELSVKQNIEQLSKDEEQLKEINQEIIKKTREFEEITQKYTEKQKKYQETLTLLESNESLIRECDSLKEVHRNYLIENQRQEKKVKEMQLKYEEFDLMINLENKNLSSLKKQSDELSKQVKDKERSLQNLDSLNQEKIDQINENENKLDKILKKLQEEADSFNNISKKKAEILEEIDRFSKRLQEIEKHLQVKELQLLSIKKEIDTKAKEYQELNDTIANNQLSYKILLKENKEILEKLKEDLKSKSAEYKEILSRVEEMKTIETHLEENIKGYQDEITSLQVDKDKIQANIQAQELQLNNLKENIRSSQDLEIVLVKKIENLTKKDSEITDKIEEMERYLQELRGEQSEIQEKMSTLSQKEDELYVLMALNGEIPDKKVLQRIKELTQSHYNYKQIKEKEKEKEKENKINRSFPSQTKSPVKIINEGVKENKHLKISTNSQKKSFMSPQIKEVVEEETSGIKLDSSNGKKKAELSLQIHEAEKEINILKKKLEVFEEEDENE